MADTKTKNDKASRLFKYLAELSRIGMKNILSWEDFEEVIWLHELMDDCPEIPAMAWRGGSDTDKPSVWLEIGKPEVKGPPPLPEALQGLVEGIHDSSSGRMTLTHTVFPEPETGKAPTAGTTVAREGTGLSAETVKLFNDYVTTEWAPWALSVRRSKTIQKVYSSMVSLYQKQSQIGEEYEILVGVGLLNWKSAEIGEICRHIFAAKGRLDFDTSKETVSLGPVAEDAGLALEQDIFPSGGRACDPDKKLSGLIDDIGSDIWDVNKVSPLLETWFNGFNDFEPKAAFKPLLEPDDSMTDEPLLSIAPALIVRKRPSRSMVSFLEKIAAQLEKAEETPPALLRVVGADEAPDSTTTEGSDDGPQEVYFPKPFNTEQEQIVGRIRKERCVVVQGPPGTGKSHTIANLVSHFLAERKRVLITGHSQRALRALHDKVPSSVAPLCVTLLDNDRDSLKELETSLGQISLRLDNWDKDKNKDQIKNAQEELHKARTREAQLLAQIASFRQLETRNHKALGYKGTLAEISKRLRLEEPGFSWVRPYLKGDVACPLSGTEAMRLLELLRLSAGKESLSQKKALDPSELPSPAEFADLISREQEHGKQLNELRPLEHEEHLGLMLKTELESLKENELRISELLLDLARLHADDEPWFKQALLDVMEGGYQQWQKLWKATKEGLDRINKGAKGAQVSNVDGLTGLNRRVVRADAADLFEHLSSGKGLGFSIFRPKVVKRCFYITELRIDGFPCNHPYAIMALIRWLDLQEATKELHEHWKAIRPVSDPDLSDRITRFGELLDRLTEVMKFGRKLYETRDYALSSIRGLPESMFQSEAEINNALKLVKWAQIESDLKTLRNEKAKRLDSVRRLKAQDFHPYLAELKESADLEDAKAYGLAFSKCENLWSFRKNIEGLDELKAKLEAVAPTLAAEMAAKASDGVWDDRMANFEAAWDWARCDALIRTRVQAGEEPLHRKLLECKDRIQRSMELLVEAKSWEAFFEKTTKKQIGHLQAWKKSFDLAPKGTGKFAAKNLKNARESMEKFKEAIPAWIMPLFKVVESFPPAPELFDVVIVDEASQPGPEALSAYYLGKRVIVLGDDKQISPTSFLDQELVDKLIDKHIADLEIGKHLGPDHSLLDIAKSLYPDLPPFREHFRCMPEIIQFSTNLCYQDSPLIPLRQYSQNRLSSVEKVYVAAGYLHGAGNKRTNPPEAEAMVERIAGCVEDPAYKGKTMGVISLMSTSDQARFIEDKLREKLGPTEMIKRRLVCGDPYDFQGDERDVIFLSMVQAPVRGKSIGPLRHFRYTQKFNVAVSRARDQVWLFHSVTKDDLSPDCLRRKIIEHFESPPVRGAFNDDLANLVAFVADKRDVRPPAPFDSWFEVDVFLKIAEAGYQVIPQLQVAGYSIDLVIEGVARKLAVECDGDKFYPPEKYERDLAGQMNLERCGWTFQRIRASAFYRNPEGALKDLWKALDRLGIESSLKKGAVEMTLSPEEKAGASPALGSETRLEATEDKQTEPSPLESQDQNDKKPVAAESVEAESELETDERLGENPVQDDMLALARISLPMK